MNKLELETLLSAIILTKIMRSDHFLGTGEAEMAVTLSRLLVDLNTTMPREEKKSTVSQ